MLNSEGASGPVDKRDDSKEANKTCDNLYIKCAATTGYKIKFDNDQNNNAKDKKRIFTELIEKWDGHYLLTTTTSSSSSSSW